MMLGNLQQQCSSYTYIAHRRAGKSVGGAYVFSWFINKLLREKEIIKLKADVDSRNPNMSYLAPTKRQARDIIWEYIRDEFSHYPGAKFNEAQLTVTIPRPLTGDRIKFHLYASKYHDRMRGTKQRMVFIDELQDAPVEALYRSVLPTLEDVGRKNSMLFASGTVKGRDHLHEWCDKQEQQGNVVRILPITRSHVYTPKEIEEIKAKYQEDVFLREFMCDFNAPLEGTFFNARLNILQGSPGFFTSTHDPNLPVLAAFDIGIGEALAVWAFQVTNENRVNILDFYQGHDDMALLREDMMDDGLYPDCIFIPHDGNTRQVVSAGVVRKKHVIKTAFPKSYVYEPLKRATRKEVAIQNTLNHLHLLHFPPKNARSDAHTGLRHLMEYGRERDKMTGHYKDVVDKGRGVDHAADSIMVALEGLRVRDGVVRRFPTYRCNEGNPYQQVAHPRNRVIQSTGSIFDSWRSGYGTYE